MKKQCVFCQEIFEPKTKRGKYCSDSCRLKFNRGTSITAGKSPEEIRDLKQKEMQQPMEVVFSTGETMEIDSVETYKEGQPLLEDKCDCGHMYCGKYPANEMLPKKHAHYIMRHHPAWSGVVYPCKTCGNIIQKTVTGNCSKCI